MFWFFLAILIILLVVIYKVFKVPKYGASICISGGLKTGKSMLAVWLSVRRYRFNVFMWKIRMFFCKLFRRKLPEKPLYYSNVKLAGIEHVLVTKELLLRQKRFAYGSVCYIQEASLVADSSMRKNELINEQLLLFNKLFAHECRGRNCCLYYDTQSISDNHFAVKRVLNNYFWIHHMKKIPFFCLLYVRECAYSYDDEGAATVTNTFNSDVEDTLKIIVVPKSVWKMYDAYCYSALTDDLPVENNVLFIPKIKWPLSWFKRPDLKMHNFVTFRNVKNFTGGSFEKK